MFYIDFKDRNSLIQTEVFCIKNSLNFLLSTDLRRHEAKEFFELYQNPQHTMSEEVLKELEKYYGYLIENGAIKPLARKTIQEQLDVPKILEDLEQSEEKKALKNCKP